MFKQKNQLKSIIFIIALYYIIANIDLANFLEHYVDITGATFGDTYLNSNSVMDIASILGPTVEPRGLYNSKEPGNNGGGSDSSIIESAEPTRKCQSCDLTDTKKDDIHSKLEQVRSAYPNPYTDRTIIRCGFEKPDMDFIKKHILHQLPGNTEENPLISRLKLGCQTTNVSTINTTAVSRIINYFN